MGLTLLVDLVGKHLVNNKNTTYIFTNCQSALGKEGEQLGTILSQLFRAGNLYFELDRSGFDPADEHFPATNLANPLTRVMEEPTIYKGWVVYKMEVHEGGFTSFERVETGKSLQLEPSGDFISSPSLDELK